MEGLVAAPGELAQGAVTFFEKRVGGLPIHAYIGDGDSVTQSAGVLGEILAARLQVASNIRPMIFGARNPESCFLARI